VLKLDNRRKRCFLAQAFDIRACEPFHLAGQFLEIDIGRQRHANAAKPHDGHTLAGVGLGERQYIVEAPAPQESRLDSLGTVCCGEQDHALDIAQVVDFAKKLAQNPLVDIGGELIGSESWREGIDRVEEQDARSSPPRFFENLTQGPLGIPQPF
jgi:hypothetical protein